MRSSTLLLFTFSHFQQGKSYLIDENGNCKSEALSGYLKEVCVPNGYQNSVQFTLGGELACTAYIYEDFQNISDFTVATDGCIPINGQFLQRSPRKIVVLLTVCLSIYRQCYLGRWSYLLGYHHWNSKSKYVFLTIVVFWVYDFYLLFWAFHVVFLVSFSFHSYKFSHDVCSLFVCLFFVCVCVCVSVCV